MHHGTTELWSGWHRKGSLEVTLSISLKSRVPRPGPASCWRSPWGRLCSLSGQPLPVLLGSSPTQHRSGKYFLVVRGNLLCSSLCPFLLVVALSSPINLCCRAWNKSKDKYKCCNLIISFLCFALYFNWGAVVNCQFEETSFTWMQNCWEVTILGTFLLCWYC